MDGFAHLRQTLRVQVQIPAMQISIDDEYDHIYGRRNLLKMKKPYTNSWECCCMHVRPVVTGVMTHVRGRPEHEQTHGQTNK